MTREEAINIMKVIVHMLEEKYDTDRVEDAVNMAIEALEQEPVIEPLERLAESASKTAKALERLKVSEQEPSNVREYDKDHIWYKGKQYISLNRFLQVKESCEDCISRKEVLSTLNKHWLNGTVARRIVDELGDSIKELPPVTPQPKTGHCKDCKYFEYDSVARVDGIPLIVAHEICSRWGDGCKTKEGGYCFLFEPQESEVRE